MTQEQASTEKTSSRMQIAGAVLIAWAVVTLIVSSGDEGRNVALPIFLGVLGVALFVGGLVVRALRR